MPSHTVVESYKTSAGTLSSTWVYTGNTDINIEEAIEAATEDHEIDIAITPANIIAIDLYCDQDATVKTNASDYPDDEIELLARKSVIWTVDKTAPVPFSADVEKFFVSVAGDTAATFRVRVLMDQSP